MDLERLLREEWWQNHGCAASAQYGDDGEQQCHECLVDFRREPMERLQEHVRACREKQLLISNYLNRIRNAIDDENVEEARKLLCEVKQIARASHPEVFFLESLLPSEEKV